MAESTNASPHVLATTDKAGETDEPADEVVVLTIGDDAANEATVVAAPQEDVIDTTLSGLDVVVRDLTTSMRDTAKAGGTRDGAASAAVAPDFAAFARTLEPKSESAASEDVASEWFARGMRFAFDWAQEVFADSVAARAAEALAGGVLRFATWPRYERELAMNAAAVSFVGVLQPRCDERRVAALRSERTEAERDASRLRQKIEDATTKLSTRAPSSPAALGEILGGLARTMRAGAAALHAAIEARRSALAERCKSGVLFMETATLVHAWIVRFVQQKIAARAQAYAQQRARLAQQTEQPSGELDAQLDKLRAVWGQLHAGYRAFLAHCGVAERDSAACLAMSMLFSHESDRLGPTGAAAGSRAGEKAPGGGDRPDAAFLRGCIEHVRATLADDGDAVLRRLRARVSKDAGDTAAKRQLEQYEARGGPARQWLSLLDRLDAASQEWSAAWERTHGAQLRALAVLDDEARASVSQLVDQTYASYARYMGEIGAEWTARNDAAERACATAEQKALAERKLAESWLDHYDRQLVYQADERRTLQTTHEYRTALTLLGQVLQRQLRADEALAAQQALAQAWSLVYSSSHRYAQ